MPNVFISYSTKDSELAQFLYNALEVAGVSAFLAEICIESGDPWKEAVLENLRQSEWVLFLATKHSCISQAVAHEIGASLVLKKKFIPVLFGVTSSELPDWVDDKQSIDLNDSERVSEMIEKIGLRIKSDKVLLGIIIGVLAIVALWYLKLSFSPNQSLEVTQLADARSAPQL